jgi:hypothetical protein
MSSRFLLAAVLASLILRLPVLSQQRGGQPNSAGQNSAQTTTGGNQSSNNGRTWVRDSWDSLTTLENQLDPKVFSIKEHPRFLLCYQLRLATGPYSTAPLVFQAITRLPGLEPGYQCINSANDKRPLMMRGFLVVAVDARNVPTGRMRSFNLNVTTTPSSPPVAVRPSAGSSGGAGSGLTQGPGGNAVAKEETCKTSQPPTWGKIYYFVWDQEFLADVIPTVAVSLTYTPPVPGTQWKPNTIYSEGSVVTPYLDPTTPQLTQANGRYFVARRGGISGETLCPDDQPEFAPVKPISDGGVSWIDSGTTQPTNVPANPGNSSQNSPSSSYDNWQPSIPYQAGSIVYWPGTKHYYVANSSGMSGANAPFSIKYVSDNGGLQWALIGKNQSSSASQTTVWQPQTPYTNGKIVYEASTGQYFDAVNGGTSGKDNPLPAALTILTFPEPSLGGTILIWGDMGTDQPQSPSTPKLTVQTRKPNHYYNAGEVIFGPASGHYFTAIQSGTSGSSPSLEFVANQEQIIYDTWPSKTSDVVEVLQDNSGQMLSGTWRYLAGNGSTCTNPPLRDWNPTATYSGNNCIEDTESQKLFQLQPPFGGKPVSESPFTPAALRTVQIGESFHSGKNTVAIGAWEYKQERNANPRCNGKDDEQWKADAKYRINDCVQAGGTNTIYQLVRVGEGNGPYKPFPERPWFYRPSEFLDKIQWQDIGNSPPALVGSGEPPDLQATQSYQLTSVHPRFPLALTTGFVVSTIHSKSFGWQTNYPGLYTPVQTASNQIIDPVQFLTIYLKKMDPENIWSVREMFPAVAFGFSLTSPTSNFYIGFNSEVHRNIQIVAGLSTASPSRLASTSVSTSNSSSPPTAQKLTAGGFIGVSFNVVNFITGKL